MRKFFVLTLLLGLFGGIAYADDKLQLSGYLKNETSIRINHMNGDLTKEKNIVELAGEYKINGDELVFFTKAKYWYDAAYDARDKLDIAQHYAGHIQRSDWLRDLYLDYTRYPWFLRLGKQQVAWGQADGITILDRVNPVDISEYWLPDMQDIRIPLWMANINYSPKLNSNLQFLLIPDFEQSTSATIGAPFCTYAYTRYDNWKNLMKRLGGSVDENIYFPDKKFENSTFGLQWSDRIGDLNYTLNYLYGYYYSARNTTIQIAPPALDYKVDRAFKRYQMYGGSFNKSVTNPGPLQGITFRGDFALYKDEPTYIGDPNLASSKKIARWNNVFWLIGADRYVFTKYLLSVQYSQYILEHAKDKDPSLTQAQQYPMNAFTYGFADQVENIFSIKVSTQFMNDRLKPEILWSFTDDNQGRLSPKVNYEIKDNLVLTVGIHYFYGNPYDSNGQYRNQNQFYTNLKYSF
ncbi:MAG: hypothetical protein Q8N80_02235 [Candidatus Omnitrophota bacterium]|nr:hypothetical protein [Candidatus Omnitrophota bacterium]